MDDQAPLREAGGERLGQKLVLPGIQLVTTKNTLYPNLDSVLWADVMGAAPVLVVGGDICLSSCLMAPAYIWCRVNGKKGVEAEPFPADFPEGRLELAIVSILQWDASGRPEFVVWGNIIERPTWAADASRFLMYLNQATHQHTLSLIGGR